MNDRCKVLRALKGVVRCRTLGVKAKRGLIEEVVVRTVLCGAETWKLNAVRVVRSTAEMYTSEKCFQNILETKYSAFTSCGVRVVPIVNKNQLIPFGCFKKGIDLSHRKSQSNIFINFNECRSNQTHLYMPLAAEQLGTLDVRLTSRSYMQLISAPDWMLSGN